MKKTIRKSCVLKMVDVAPALDCTFSDAIANAFSVIDKAHERRFAIDKESKRYRILNDCYPPVGNARSCRGSIFAFTEDQDLNGVVLDPNARSYSMKTLRPPRTKEARTEFVEGLTWFAVHENTIAFFTDRAVSTEILEEYFSWFLTSAYRKSRNDSSVHFQVLFRNPPNPDLSNYDMTGVSGLVYVDSFRPEAGASGRAQSEEQGFVFGSSGRKWRFSDMFGASVPEMATVNDIFQREDLKIELKISRSGRSLGERQGFILQRIAESLRNTASGNISFRFSDGRVLNAASLEHSTVMSFSSENGIPETATVVRRLDEWLMKRI